MSVASMLENMKRRALDSTYDAYICEEYDAWAVESFATEEGEYDAARLELPKVLSSEQMEKLKTMEERYRQNRKYASHYGFEAGLFSGFQLFFSGNGITEDGFDRYLMKSLMEMPGMQRHVDYYARLWRMPGCYILSIMANVRARLSTIRNCSFAGGSGSSIFASVCPLQFGCAVAVVPLFNCCQYSGDSMKYFKYCGQRSEL